jgi:pyruvate/2-oxoglutarate dehydrogenase complex dihydrolipoamide acyltransferase (E2) component
MPDVTSGADDGVLAAWLVEESARFDAAQTIAYVETDDELFSVEAGRPGLLLTTLVEPGTRVPPGTPIGVLGEPWEQVHDVDVLLVELGVERRERVGTPSSWFDNPVAGHAAVPEEAVSLVVPEPLTVVAEVTPKVSLPEPVSEPVSEPALEPETQPVTQGAQGAHAAVVEPEPGVVQHHYLRTRVRVDRLVALSAQLESDTRASGVTGLVVRAVAAAHRQVPQLVVAELEDARGAAPGIPVSDPGRFGVAEAAPVVPSGHSAALAIGAVRDEPLVDGGVVVPAKVLTLTLSVRPGRVDDVQASRWLAVLVALLERPEWLLD